MSSLLPGISALGRGGGKSFASREIDFADIIKTLSQVTCWAVFSDHFPALPQPGPSYCHLFSYISPGSVPPPTSSPLQRHLAKGSLTASGSRPAPPLRRKPIGQALQGGRQQPSWPPGPQHESHSAAFPLPSHLVPSHLLECSSHLSQRLHSLPLKRRN